MVATLATIPGRFGHDNVIRYCSQAMGVPIELRCRRPCQILRPLFLGSLAGELVGPLVFRMAGMTFDPLPMNGVRAGGVEQGLPEVGVLDGLSVGGAPAIFLPAENPFGDAIARSEEHTSELQSLMRISYAVFC